MQRDNTIRPRKNVKVLFEELASPVGISGKVVEEAEKIWREMIGKEEVFTAIRTARSWGMKSLPTKAREVFQVMGLDDQRAIEALIISMYILRVVGEKAETLYHGKRWKYYNKFSVRRRLVPSREGHVVRKAGVLSYALALGIAYANQQVRTDGASGGPTSISRLSEGQVVRS